MEGKAMILSVLIMGMVLVQTQVEAKSCCSSSYAQNVYNTCRFTGGSRDLCARLSGCKIVSAGSTCPQVFLNGIAKTSGNAVNDYCKLGCASSLCGALNALQTFDASEIVIGAVEQCNKACSTLCTKNPMNAFEIV